jgi:glyoxylase-like metal-dependent hydrolase (beta-lactamase superfamily II)/rhodanese-related sulfurtransferase
MKVEQVYSNCLAQAGYYIESNGEAAIIDPLRDTSIYLEMAKRNGATIRCIFETHFHADFVSGHLDLARETGSWIVYGPTAEPGFDAIIADDGQKFRIGAVTIQLLHTPGHTMESSCFLLYDETGEKKMLFTGDTLFLGDVGRPDLAQDATGMSKEMLAGLLYDSIHNKILPLPDDIILYPAHGAGSACGKQMSTDRFDTLGHQKKINYALAPGLTIEDFIVKVLEGLLPPPRYFPVNAQMNKYGYGSIHEILQHGNKALEVETFKKLWTEGQAMILDTRKGEDFAKGFIPGSVNIGIDGDFAPWAGTLIKNNKQSILLVAPEGREEETIIRLARVGYDHCTGFLKGGIDAWIKENLPIDRIRTVSASGFNDLLKSSYGINIVDVRRKPEFDEEHISGVIHLPLEYVHEQFGKLDPEQTYYVYCAGGYRSMIFISLLQSKGYHKLVNVEGGFQTLKEIGSLYITRKQNTVGVL